MPSLRGGRAVHCRLWLYASFRLLRFQD